MLAAMPGRDPFGTSRRPFSVFARRNGKYSRRAHTKVLPPARAPYPRAAAAAARPVDRSPQNRRRRPLRTQSAGRPAGPCVTVCGIPMKYSRPPPLSPPSSTRPPFVRPRPAVGFYRRGSTHAHMRRAPKYGEYIYVRAYIHTLSLPRLAPTRSCTRRPPRTPPLFGRNKMALFDIRVSRALPLPVKNFFRSSHWSAPNGRSLRTYSTPQGTVKKRIVNNMTLDDKKKK